MPIISVIYNIIVLFNSIHYEWRICICWISNNRRHTYEIRIHFNQQNHLFGRLWASPTGKVLGGRTVEEKREETNWACDLSAFPTSPIQTSRTEISVARQDVKLILNLHAGITESGYRIYASIYICPRLAMPGKRRNRIDEGLVQKRAFGGI